MNYSNTRQSNQHIDLFDQTEIRMDKHTHSICFTYWLICYFPVKDLINKNNFVLVQFIKLFHE